MVTINENEYISNEVAEKICSDIALETSQHTEQLMGIVNKTIERLIDMHNFFRSTKNNIDYSTNKAYVTGYPDFSNTIYTTMIRTCDIHPDLYRFLTFEGNNYALKKFNPVIQITTKDARTIRDKFSKKTREATSLKFCAFYGAATGHVFPFKTKFDYFDYVELSPFFKDPITIFQDIFSSNSQDVRNFGLALLAEFHKFPEMAAEAIMQDHTKLKNYNQEIATIQTLENTEHYDELAMKIRELESV